MAAAAGRQRGILLPELGGFQQSQVPLLSTVAIVIVVLHLAVAEQLLVAAGRLGAL